jgi:hypothetical protein
VLHQGAQQLLDTLVAAGQARGWIKARGKQRRDSTHVLAAIRTLNRLECVLIGRDLRNLGKKINKLQSRRVAQSAHRRGSEPWNYARDIKSSSIARSKLF